MDFTSHLRSQALPSMQDCCEIHSHKTNQQYHCQYMYTDTENISWLDQRGKKYKLQQGQLSRLYEFQDLVFCLIIMHFRF